MRILYVHYMDPESGRGGMGVHIRSSTEALRALGHEVLVFSKPQKAPTAAVVGPAVDHRSRLRRQFAKYAFEPRALLRVPLRLPREWRAARAFRPDVAVVRYEAFEYQMWIVCALLGIPLVVEVNATSRELTRWRSDGVFVYPFTHALERAVLRRAQRLSAVSTTLRRLLIEDGVAEDRIAVIPNGADTARFRPDVDGQVIRAKYGLENRLVVGYLGSFGKWHDIQIIADVIPRITARHPNVRFLLAGATLRELPGPVQQRLAPLQDAVVFTGIVPLAEAPCHVAAMDIALTVYPPIPDFHMSAIKLFEYMAAGRPVVASAIGQQSEVVEDGINGVLVPPGDPAALERAVDSLIRYPALRGRLGQAARDTVVQRYTWAHNARRIEALCSAAIADPRGTPRSRHVDETAAVQTTAAPPSSVARGVHR